MKIIATPKKGKDLRTGDLFSSVGPTYWDHHKENHSLGEKVYIRTEQPCPEDQRREDVFKITIKR